MKHEYDITLGPIPEEDGGGWLVRVPDLPGCMADGDSPDDALSRIGDAIDAWIAAARDMGRDVPQPRAAKHYSGKYVVRMPATLHRRLAELAESEGVSLNALTTNILAESVGERRRA